MRGIPKRESTNGYERESEAIVESVKSQRQKFIDKARELGVDEDEADFNERLKQLVRRKPRPTDNKKVDK